MKKLIIGLSFFTMLGVSHGATQIYIPSTSTFHNYTINIGSGTINNLNVTTGTAGNITLTTATITNANLTNISGTIVDNSTTTHTGTHTFATIVPSSVTASNLTASVANIPQGNYRKPVLEFVNTSTVDVENNTGTANNTQIVFPDGVVRNGTETSSSGQYRYLNILATATFTGAGPQICGRLTGTTIAANTWWAIYAVKSQVTNNTTSFVLVAATNTPTQGNYGFLNSNFSSNGWVYLGLIRFGDNNAATTSVLNFSQSGNLTCFRNVASFGGGSVLNGTYLASNTNVAASTFTYAAGVGAAQIPDVIKIGIVLLDINTGTTGSGNLSDSGGNYTIYQGYSTGTILSRSVTSVLDGFRANMVAGSNAAITLSGFYDNALGVTATP